MRCAVRMCTALLRRRFASLSGLRPRSCRSMCPYSSTTPRIVLLCCACVGRPAVCGCAVLAVCRPLSVAVLCSLCSLCAGKRDKGQARQQTPRDLGLDGRLGQAGSVFAFCASVRFGSLVLFVRYALAAVMLKQLTYKQAVQHKTAVLKVASTASAEGRTSLLGVFWDEVVRLEMFSGKLCVASSLFAFLVLVQARLGGQAWQAPHVLPRYRSRGDVGRVAARSQVSLRRCFPEGALTLICICSLA